MATSLPISEAEYLNATYRPDVDYVDGHIEERDLGDYDHADMQMWIGFLLRGKQKARGIKGASLEIA